MNAPGSGVADDKLVGGRVDDLVRLYLGEEPLLPSVPSRAVGPDDELDDLVVKPRGEMGGEGVVIWRDADEAPASACARDRAEPGGWIGQDAGARSRCTRRWSTAGSSRATSTCGRTRS